MIAIILAVYKSCTKNRENQSRLDFPNYPTMTNTDYMSSDSNTNQHNEFSPPPPPYGMGASSVNPPGFKPEYIYSTNTSSNNSQSGLGTFLAGATIGGIGSYLLRAKSR